MRNPPTFSDVPSTHFAHRYLEAMSDQQLTTGCGGGLFCPLGQLTRAQLAAVLLAGLKEAGGSCATPPYPDVPGSHPSCPAIARFKSLGLATPCDAGFCPDAPVNRGDTAAFCANALQYIAGNPTLVGGCHRTPPDYCDP